MARRLTDKLQIGGYRLMVARIEQAFIARDMHIFNSPFTSQNRAYGMGFALAALVVGAALALSLISPQARLGDAKILATKKGSRYVVVDGVVHPVLNLSSARLITGSPADIKTVSDKDLKNYPRGQLMGIPSAPDEMINRSEHTARWAVCSQYSPTSELSLTKTDNARTLFLAGEDAISEGDRRMTASDMLVVRQSRTTADGSTSDDDIPTDSIWLLFGTSRVQLTDTSAALRTTLGLTDSVLKRATPVTKEFLDTVPARATLATPVVAREGDTSSVVSDQRIGSVITTSGADGRQYWLIGDSGVQKIGRFVATLLVNSGATSVTSGVSTQSMADQPQVTLVDVGEYPWQMPKIKTGADTVCYDWQRHGQSQAQTHFLAGDGVPMSTTARQNVVALLPPRNDTPQSDFFYTAPGKGWLVSVTGSTSNSHTDGQLWWISDSGVRSAIGTSDKDDVTKVVAMLGITGGSLRIPWSILRLLPAGNTLAPDSAKVVHAAVPPDMAQAAVPDVEGLN